MIPLVLVDDNNADVRIFIRRMNEHLSTLRPKSRLDGVSIRFEGKRIETTFKLTPLERITMLTVDAWNALNSRVEEELNALVEELSKSSDLE